MPVRQPFTHLCQQTARGINVGRADLHAHTNHSDGAYTPVQLVDLARRCGLAALAITDHDTLSGIQAAQSAAAGTGLEIVPGVEITTEFRGRELHLLAFFVRLDDAPLQAALSWVRGHRADRFNVMVKRLRAAGVSLDEGALPVAGPTMCLGRRHLAEALVRSGRVGSIRDAFRRFLSDKGRIAEPKQRLPVGEALALVRAAGGVAAWAHPSYDCDRANLLELRGLGLGAVEAEYPDFRNGRKRLLRELASSLGLAITGGSDCHGPGRRTVGTCTISAAELDQLRQRADD